MPSFTPDPNSGVPLVRQFYEQLAAQIDKGQLKPGSKLPSVRQQARETGVSTMTITNAYARLVAEHYVEAWPGSGYYVASAPAQTQARRKPFVGRTSVDSLWLLRRVYEDDSTLLNAGCGWIRPDWLHIDGVRHALASLARKNAAGLANYGTPQGYLPLRQHLESLLAQRAIEAPPHQIVLTHGASQALDIVARALLQPREIALVDSPGSTNFFATLRAQGVRPVGVARRVDGPDLQALEALAQRHRPKVFFTTLHLHNPTGSSCSPTVAYQILRLAEQYGFHVVENDVMAGLEPSGLPNLASLGQLDRVIYIGSFGKTI
ncbi:MAG: 2-aminoadipate transaminase [Paracidovorax wautersii]|uniref:2-aminoadipate transaminase n=1 Tax=Paracidovorax wautersii TaxID=1177982 RepID=A0A7V8JRA2_9BURK|nr:MAG: 2-aminoadipate transaminase [Paracidovorax wautersii]